MPTCGQHSVQSSSSKQQLVSDANVVIEMQFR